MKGNYMIDTTLQPSIFGFIAGVVDRLDPTHEEARWYETRDDVIDGVRMLLKTYDAHQIVVIGHTGMIYTVDAQKLNDKDIGGIVLNAIK